MKFLAVPLLVCGVLFFPVLSMAEDSCALHFQEVHKQSQDATASIFANLFKRRGSINYESQEIFLHLKKKFQTLERPESFCPSGCKLDQTPRMVFRSTPKKFRLNYSDKEKCEELLSETKQIPIRYSVEALSSLEALEEWIENISRGKGKIGKDLYRRCDGNCSPQYHYSIFKNNRDGESLSVSAEIICGHARDKDDNMYELTHSFRWVCEKI